MSASHQARQQPIIPKVNQTKPSGKRVHTPSQGTRAPATPLEHWWGSASSSPSPHRAAGPQKSSMDAGAPCWCLGSPCCVCTSCLHSLISWHYIALYIIQLNTKIKYVLWNHLARKCHALFGHGHFIVLLLILSLINPVEFFQHLTWCAVLEVGLLKVWMVQHSPHSEMSLPSLETFLLPWNIILGHQNQGGCSGISAQMNMRKGSPFQYILIISEERVKCK